MQNEHVFSYKLPFYEGPLDLLLTLIAKNKLNIYDIQISLLLEQYTLQIEEMNTYDMDVSSDFLEMAARLVHIKTVSLLPKHEEAEQLKQELTGQLIEYRLMRRVAEMLAPMASFDSMTRAAAEIEYDQTYARVHPAGDICNAYMSAVGRGKRRLPPPKEAFSGIIEKKIVPVSTKIIHVLRRLWSGVAVSYSSLFKETQNRSELVATFLAVLELIKGKRVRIDGSGEDTKVKIVKGGDR